MRGYLFILIISSFFLTLIGCNDSNESFVCTLSGEVCGVDGVTYTNKCDADNAGVSVAYSGKCETPTFCASTSDCPPNFVCEDIAGVKKCVVDSECDVDSDCSGEISIDCIGAHWECQSGSCIESCGSECPDIMCAIDCEFGFKIDENGCSICECVEATVCEQDSDCPEGFFCALMDCADEVDCIGGGVCYPKEQPECDENTPCALGEVCVNGVCETQNCDCPTLFAPVCGENGITYGNACFAACDNAIIAHEGECEEILCESDSDCPNGFFCALVDCSDDDVDCLGGSICMPIQNNCPHECDSDIDCDEGFFCSTIRCITDSGLTGSVCEKKVECEPILCDLYCEFGFILDENGCEICQCNEPHNICYSDDECPDGQFCHLMEDVDYGYCQPNEIECRVDSDCESGAQCLNGLCIINFCPSECEIDSDCGDGFYCSQIYCLTPDGVPGTECVMEFEYCESDLDCSEGEYCLDGLCFVQSACFHDCDSDRDCEEGFSCIQLDCLTVDGETGSVCEWNNQCEDLTCDLYCEFGFQVDDNGCEICVCNQPDNICYSNDECPDGYYCEFLDGCYLDENGEIVCVDYGYCQPNEIECRVDSDCFDNEVCIDNICMDNSYQCTHECDSNSDCVEGEICEAIRCITSDGQQGSVCSF
ncbi:hypothetical protein JXR93_03985 [bacterium]|nr:hypothetical protein [bacterium]